MVLPPSKRQKAPKTAWTQCPSRFFTIPPSATSCSHFPLQGGGEKVNLFFSARFSHFIDNLTADEKSSAVYFFCDNLLSNTQN